MHILHAYLSRCKECWNPFNQTLRQLKGNMLCILQDNLSAGYSASHCSYVLASNKYDRQQQVARASGSGQQAGQEDGGATLPGISPSKVNALPSPFISIIEHKNVSRKPICFSFRMPVGHNQAKLRLGSDLLCKCKGNGIIEVMKQVETSFKMKNITSTLVTKIPKRHYCG